MPDFKNYNNATMIKAVCFWYQDRRRYLVSKTRSRKRNTFIGIEENNKNKLNKLSPNLFAHFNHLKRF